jgi:inorganic phosphate transporter, PiT family
VGWVIYFLKQKHMLEYIKNIWKKPIFRIEILAIILVAVTMYVYIFKLPGGEYDHLLIIATILWLFMAMWIWANDIANNMWPAVWSKALTLFWAIIIAAIFETAWVMIAWGDVVDTIKKWIIDPELITDQMTFIYIMLSTLLWAALWLGVATFFKAPVSTTHSVIGWLIWAWVSATWFSIVKWSVVWKIAASWIVSPIMWGLIAIITFTAIRKTILLKEDRSSAAKMWVPIFVWIMTSVFSVYLVNKWLKNILDDLLNSIWIQEIKSQDTIVLWLIIWVIVYIIIRFILERENYFLKNSKKAINKLFNIPLIFAVALLSFAHW